MPSFIPSRQQTDEFVAAAGNGDLAAVTAYLDLYPTFVNVVNSSGVTALTTAAVKGQPQIAALLLQQKHIQVDKRDENGKTALMHAVLNQNITTAEVLLAKGASIDAKDFSFWTILMQAAHAGLEQSVKFLLEKGAATDWVDENDQTAEMVARWAGHAKIAALIDGWSILPSGEEKKAQPAETPARNLAAERLERLKNQRPRQSPLKKKGPQP